MKDVTINRRGWQPKPLGLSPRPGCPAWAHCPVDVHQPPYPALYRPHCHNYHHDLGRVLKTVAMERTTTIATALSLDLFWHRTISPLPLLVT